MRATPLPVPTTSIYSRSDGIVAWQCCVSEPAPHTENVEVSATHLGYGHHLETLRVIADRLAQPEGTWAPWADRAGTGRTRRPPTTGRSDAVARSRWASPLDSIFLMGESPETLMHVGSLLHFSLPRGRGRGVPARPRRRRAVGSGRAAVDAAPPDPARDAPARAPLGRGRPLRRRLPRPALRPARAGRRARARHPRLAAALEPDRLPSPAVGGALHRGRRARAGSRVYTKIHHSLVDGYTGTRILQRGLSEDPDDRTHPHFFSLTKPPRAEGVPREPVGDVASILRSVSASVTAMPAVARSILGTQLRRGETTTRAVTSYQAPVSVLNGHTGRSRRFATQQYDLERLRAVARREERHPQRRPHGDLRRAGCAASSATSTSCPDRPLIAFVPVNVRAAGQRGRRQLRRRDARLARDRHRRPGRRAWPPSPPRRAPPRPGCAG